MSSLRAVALLAVAVLSPLLQFLLPGVLASPVVEEVATGLDTPWSLAFTRDGTIYVTERHGTIRVVRQGILQQQPAATIGTTESGESGLLGLALDPDLDTNGLAYVYYTYTDSQSRLVNRISRLTENNGIFGNERVLLDGIGGGGVHDGGRLKIGPDGKLYATTGDANISGGQVAQDPSSLNGKILRLHLDGSIPSDNPDPASRVYSLGHRNPQGITWDTAGHLVESEHGPTGGFGSPCCNDEINLIEPGHNYGWPNVYGIAEDPRYDDPILSTGSDTWAPSGIAYYSASAIPEWTGTFLVGTLRGEHLRVLDVSFSPTPRVVSSTSFFTNTYGRLRDVVQGPDGFVYVTTSNQDGRGTPRPGDDKILKITSPGGPSGTVFPVYLSYIAIVGVAVVVALIAVILLRMKRRPGSENRSASYAS